jgi:uncharacterized membrane protein
MTTVLHTPTSAQAARARLMHLARRLPLDALLAFVLGSLALGLGLYRLGAPSLWMDETYSVELSRQPLSTLWLAFTGGEPHMILYDLLLHGYLGLLAALGIPASEFAVRLPSALCAGGSAAVIFALGRRFLGRFAGVLAALLYLLNVSALTAAQQTRSYALQVLLVSLAWYALLVALAPARDAARDADSEVGALRQLRWWALFVVMTVLACYAQIFSLLVVLAQVAAFGVLYAAPSAWRAAARARLRPFLVSLGSITLLTLPLVVVSLRGSKTSWLPRPSLGDLRHLFVEDLLGQNSRLLLPALGLCALGLALAPWLAYRHYARSQRTADRDGPRALSPLRTLDAAVDAGLDAVRASLSRGLGYRGALGAVLVCWALVPAVASFIISQGPTRVFSGRYLVVVLPAVTLLASLAVVLLPRAETRALVAAGLLLPAVLGTPGYYPQAQVEDWRTPTRWLEREYQSGDGLVCYNNLQGCQVAVQYYLHTDGSSADFSAESPGAYIWAAFASRDPAANYRDALDTQALARYAAGHPRVFFIEGRLADQADAADVAAVQTWLDAHYRFVAQTSSDVAIIRLYTTTAPQ